MKTPRIATGILLLLVCGCPSDSDNAHRARYNLKSLDKALTAYKAKHNRWPDTLEQLTEQQPDGSKAFLEALALTDPWGRPYHYDPTDRDPATGFPLVWSEGARPGEEGSKIVNRSQ